MTSKSTAAPGPLEALVSLRELATLWRTHRTTARRVLTRAGIRPVIFNEARNGLLRFRLREVQAFVESCVGREDNGVL